MYYTILYYTILYYNIIEYNILYYYIHILAQAPSWLELRPGPQGPHLPGLPAWAGYSFRCLSEPWLPWLLSGIYLRFGKETAGPLG